jgi:hypothetical protein
MTTAEATIALHHAVDTLVLERMAAIRTFMLTWKDAVTSQITTAMNMLPVVRLLDPDFAMVVPTF